MGGASIAPVHSSVVRYVNGLINRPLSRADFEGVTALNLATPPNIPLVAPPHLNTEFEVRRLPREVSLRERSYLGAQAATSAMAVGICRFLRGGGSRPPVVSRRPGEGCPAPGLSQGLDAGPGQVVSAQAAQPKASDGLARHPCALANGVCAVR